MEEKGERKQERGSIKGDLPSPTKGIDVPANSQNVLTITTIR